MLVSTVPRWRNAAVSVQSGQHRQIGHLPAHRLWGLRDVPATEPQGLYQLGPNFNVGSCVRVYKSFWSTLKVSVFLQELFIFDCRGSRYYLRFSTSVEKAQSPGPHWCWRGLLFLTLFSSISFQRTKAFQLSSQHKTNSIALLGRMRLHIATKTLAKATW